MARVTALQFRRQQRRSATDHERALWLVLRSRRLAGAKFRRQRTLGPYTVDFVCLERRVVVEVDGGGHFLPDGQDRDRRRDAYLHSRGFRVLRFSNVEVLENPEGVQEAIWHAVRAELPEP